MCAAIIAATGCNENVKVHIFEPNASEWTVVVVDINRTASNALLHKMKIQIRWVDWHMVAGCLVPADKIECFSCTETKVPDENTAHAPGTRACLNLISHD